MLDSICHRVINGIFYFTNLDHTDIAAHVPDIASGPSPVQVVTPKPVTIKPPHSPLPGVLTVPSAAVYNTTEDPSKDNNDFFNRAKILVQLKKKNGLTKKKAIQLNPKNLPKIHKMVRKLMMERKQKKKLKKSFRKQKEQRAKGKKRNKKRSSTKKSKKLKTI